MKSQCAEVTDSFSECSREAVLAYFSESCSSKTELFDELFSRIAALPSALSGMHKVRWVVILWRVICVNFAG